MTIYEMRDDVIEDIHFDCWVDEYGYWHSGTWFVSENQMTIDNGCGFIERTD